MMNASELPERHVELAKAALQLQQAGFHEDALELVEKSIRLAPGYVTAYVLQGLSLQSLERAEAAEIAFRKALKLEPKNELAYKSYGLFLEQQGKYPEAIPLLEKYNQKHPEDKIILDKLVFALSTVNESGKIQAILEQSWNKTGDAETGIRFTRFLLGNQENTRALAVIQKVADAFPSPRTLTELSLVLVVLEKYREAITVLEDVLDMDPKFDRALRGLSFCCTKLDRLDEAIEFADRALAINNKHYRNWQAKGDALLALGKFEEALYTSQTALDLIDIETEPEAEPVMDVLYLQRFNALLGLGKEDEALSELESARKKLPKEERFYIFPAQLLLGLGHADQAVELIEEARKANMLSHFPHDLRIRILLEAGQYQDLWNWLDPQLGEQVVDFLTQTAYESYLKGEGDISRHIFEHLSEKFPNLPQFATYLGFILTGDGEYDQAKVILTPILTSGADEIKPLAACNLGYVYLATGELEKAKQIFEMVFLQAPDESDAIVHVGFWQKGSHEFCCSPYPLQSLPLKLAALANLVAVHLHEENLSAAETASKQIAERYSQFSLAYQVFGSLENYKGNVSAARLDWQKAIELSSDQIETQMIQDWLEKLGAEA